MSDRMGKIRKILSDIGKGFKADYELGREDTTRMYYTERDFSGKADDAPRWENMMGTNPGIFRVKEALGKTAPAQRDALQHHDMHLRGSTAHKTGQFLGSAAADLTQDRTRGIYWLLNALQATGEVINESVLAKAAPTLYGTSAVMHPTRMQKVDGVSKRRPLQLGRPEDIYHLLTEKMIRRDTTGNG